MTLTIIALIIYAIAILILCEEWRRTLSVYGIFDEMEKEDEESTT